MASLLLVGSFDRDDVGESWVAYQWVKRLAEVHDVTVLTSGRFAGPDLALQVPAARVIQWAEPPVPRRLARLNSMLKPWYPLFYVWARRWARRALRAGNVFDIAHQITPVAMRYPCPLAGLGIPYVIGPVGGSLENPDGFSDDKTTPWFVQLRRVDRFRLRHDPMLRNSFADAASVIGIAPYVRYLLDDIPLHNFVTMTDTGIEELPERVDRSGRTGDVRLLFVGRLVRTKGAREAILAMDRLRDLPVVLDLVGDGYDRHSCEELVQRLGLGSRVEFHGRVSRAEVDAFYRSADVFVFPSYREAGGLVVAEAMGFGLPMVVCANGGPGDVVDDSCGFRIDPTTPSDYVADISSAVRRLVRDGDLRASLGEAARERVARVGLWQGKIERVCAIYSEISRARSRAGL